MKDRGGILWRFALLVGCLAAAAVNTGNNLLYLVLSVMVAAGAVAFVITGRSLGRLTPKLLIPDEVAAGDRFVIGVEAAAAEGRWPTGWAEATPRGFPVETAPLHLPAMAPGGRTVVSSSTRALKRGIHESIAIDLLTTFPFGLLWRRRRVPLSSRLVVTPRRRGIRTLRIDAPAAGSSPRGHRPGEGADLFNIREYTTQDDARRIDWKASARLERTMLKEFERDQERAVEIVLDERIEPGTDPDAFEVLVETAASILDHCGQRGIKGRLLVASGTGRTIPLEGRAAMSYLAGVSARYDAPAPVALARPGGGASTGGAWRGGAWRIVLSTDPAERTSLHIEWAEPRRAG